MFMVLSCSTHGHVRRDLHVQWYRQGERLRGLRSNDGGFDGAARSCRAADPGPTAAPIAAPSPPPAMAPMVAPIAAPPTILAPLAVPPEAFRGCVLIGSTRPPTSMSVRATLNVGWPFILLPESTALTTPNTFVPRGATIRPLAATS